MEGSKSFVGLFCAACGVHSGDFDQIWRRKCLACGAQFPEEIQSNKMRRLSLRPDIGEVAVPKSPPPLKPDSAEAILAAGAGKRSAATLAAAAAVVISGGKGGTSADKAAVLQGGGGKVTKDEEKTKQKEALRLEWTKWQAIHAEDIAQGGPPSKSTSNSLIVPRGLASTSTRSGPTITKTKGRRW